MTRSIGDFYMHTFGVTWRPEVRVIDLAALGQRLSQLTLILASDGVWDVLSDADAVRLVIERLEATNGGNTASGACAAVVQAVKAKSDDATPDDDVSVVVVVVRAKQ